MNNDSRKDLPTKIDSNRYYIEPLEGDNFKAWVVAHDVRVAFWKAHPTAYEITREQYGEVLLRIKKQQEESGPGIAPLQTDIPAGEMDLLRGFKKDL